MRFNDLFQGAVCLAGALASAALSGCAVSAPPGHLSLLDPSPPSARDVLPPHAAMLEGRPVAVDPAALTGGWRSDACQLQLGAGQHSGVARLSGDCPAVLMEVNSWRLEPDQRMRVDLFSGDGQAPAWSGLMIGPDRLIGRAEGLGGWAWARDSASASTPGG